MITSTIKFLQIEDRIDAEYYKPEYLELESNLKNNKHIADVTNFISRGPQPIYASIKTNYFVVTSKFLNNFLLDTSNLPNVLDNFFDKFSTFQLKYGDILMYSTGAYVGSVSIFLENINSLASNHVTIIRSNKKINPFYLGIFLCSNLGNIQVYRNITGATQKEIFVDKIKQFLIPIPSQSFQRKIEKMVKEAQRKRKLADEKYKEAEEILNKELGLKDLDLSTQKIFEAKFSEVEDRFDPEHYQPKYKRIISKFKSQRSKTLGEIAKIRKGIEVGHEAYTNEGEPFIRVQDYNEKELIVSGSTNYIRPYLYEELKENHKPLPGEIIYSKDGTVGRAFVILRDNHKFVVSGGILILTPRDIDNYYLALVLNFPIVKSQADRESIGAIIQHLSIEGVKNLKIPILPQLLQQKISSLIRQSFKLRREAKGLIQKAKREVEGMVEGK